jgi:hypothetical protein
MTRDELEALPTEELRAKAFDVAEHRLDVAFFWDLLKHLPSSDNAAGEDAFTAAPAAISDLLQLFREFRGEDLGEVEPLLRAKFVDYLTEHPPRS